MAEVNLASISIARHLGNASSLATGAVASVAVVRLLAVALALQSVQLDEMVLGVAAWWSALVAVVRPVVVRIVATGSAPSWTPR